MTHATYDSYKESGIPWLAKVPAGWEVVKLKILLKDKAGAIKTGPFGSQLKSEDMASGTIKVYNQRNVLDKNFNTGENYISGDKYKLLQAFTVFAGDLLVTTRGTIGKCALLPDDAEIGILHPCLMRLQLSDKQCYPYYISLLIQDGTIILSQLKLASNATTIEVIYSETLKNVFIPLPPLTEQKAITEFLDTKTAQIDALIAKKKNLLKLLAEQRTALITNAVTRGLDDSAPMKDSGITWLGKVPNHWEVRKFANFYSSRMGQTILANDVKESGKIPVLSATEKESIFGYIETADVVLQPNDLVIPARGTIGHVKLVKFPCTSTQTTILCRRIKPANPNFIYYYLIGLRKVLFYFDKTAIPQLTVNQVKSNPLLVPPIAEQKAIADFLDCKTAEIDATKDRITTAIDTLKEYRTALITNAVTGKIDVRHTAK